MKLLVILCVLPLIYCLDNGLALKPAMGWNPWEAYGCNVNETLIKQSADALISSGLAAVGYEYVNLDDCWQSSRDPTTGEIQADPNTFPSGIKALADYVHNLGLKFGVYSDAGAMTCQGRPGGLYHEVIDANTYASWGVDYLKYDNCYNEDLSPETRYPRMRDALNQTGRPIYYSLCEWGQDDPWNWAAPVGNSWRTTMDIGDTWESMMGVVEQQALISSFGGPGGWNDPDILEVGLGGMTNTEYAAHFALWAYMKAPLLIGCGVTDMTNETLTILTNTELIAVNQDPLGKPAVQLYNQSNQQIWGGPVVDGYVALLFNAGDATVNITAEFSLFNLTGAYNVRDLSAHQDLGSFENSFTAEVPSHGAAAIKLTRQQDIAREFLPIMISN